MAPIAHYLARVKARMIELGFTLDEDCLPIVERPFSSTLSQLRR